MITVEELEAKVKAKRALLLPQYRKSLIDLRDDLQEQIDRIGEEIARLQWEVDRESTSE